MLKKPVKKQHQKPFENSTIYNDNGEIVTSLQEILKIIHFHKEDVTQIEKHIGEPKQLNQIINTQEILKALTKMSNQKSAAKDNIPVELLKNASNIVNQQI